MQDIETFGKYQLFVYSLITLPLLLSAGFTLDYVFTAGEVKYRCLVPECELANTTTLEGPEWLKSSEKDKCVRYQVKSNQDQLGKCSSQSFTNITLPCDSFVYDPDELTIMNEWGFPCKNNKWRLTLIGTLNNVGQLVGLSFASYMSDKYGRLSVLTMITFLAGISGIIHSFSVNYWMFATFEFINAYFSAGLYSACFIYAMEMTGTSKRIMGSVLLSCLFAVGEIWYGLLAMWTKNWRFLIRATYGPGIVVIMLRFLLPESVRWLQANNKLDEAEKVYRKMAKVNNLKLTDEAFIELLKINGNNKLKDEKTPESKEESRIAQISKSKKLLIRLLICSFCWLTNTFVYYGLSLNSTSFAGNKYVNFILVVAIEIPGNILVYPLVNTFGRKATLCASFILSGFFCLAIQFLPKDGDGLWQLLPLIFVVCGKGCITMAFSTSYVYTTELFPTTLRHSLLGICSMTGRIGSILAPQTPLLDNLYKGLPLIFFGSMSLVAGSLSLTFPETLGETLPDTIIEAEEIGKKKKNEIIE